MKERTRTRTRKHKDQRPKTRIAPYLGRHASAHCPLARARLMSSCAPLVSARVLRPLMLFITLALRAGLLVALIVTGAYDLTFYTYINLTLVVLLSPLGIIGLFFEPLQRFYMRWVFPVLVQSTLFVSVAITAIVQLNSSVYMVHAKSLGGDVDDGTLHSGDYLVHQFTAIIILVDLIVQHHFARAHVRSLWLCASRCFRAFYTLYILFGAIVPIGLYAMIENWSERYPVPVSPLLVWLVGVPLLCAFFGGWYILFMLSTDDVTHLHGCAHVCDACQHTSIAAKPACAEHAESVCADASSVRQRARGNGTLPSHAWAAFDSDTLGAALEEVGEFEV